MDETEGVGKRFMFVNRRAPHGSIYGLEMLELILITAAFEQQAAIVFLDDGVFQLKRGQDTAALGVKNFSPTYRAVEDDREMDVEWRIIVERESMAARGLTADDMIVEVEVMDASALSALMAAQDVVFSG